MERRSQSGEEELERQIVAIREAFKEALELPRPTRLNPQTGDHEIISLHLDVLDREGNARAVEMLREAGFLIDIIHLDDNFAGPRVICNGERYTGLPRIEEMLSSL